LAHYNLAVLYDRMGDAKKARAAYEAALKADPLFEPAILGAAAMYQRLGHFAGAAQILDGALTKAPKAWALKAARAQLRAQEGKLDAARQEAIEVLKGDETNAGAMLALGMVYRRQKKNELATLALNQAIKLDANSGAAYNELALVLLSDDKLPQAVAAFERAAELSPEVAAVHNNLGTVRNEVGAFRGAIKALLRATTLRPDVASYHLNLGNAYRGDQQYDLAEKEYKLALEVGGGTVQALFNLGVLYLDNEMGGLDVTKRNEACIGYLDKYVAAMQGKLTPKDLSEIDEYRKTAQDAITAEQKRIERAKKRAEKEKAAAERAGGTPEPAAGEGEKDQKDAQPNP
jgi:tetratricopeptide (TPR) repeat protein